jgi:aspartate kinase
MRIFKFGGASVKDAESVQNVVSVLEKVGYTNTLMVVSAMGKTTNALEEIIQMYLSKSPELKNAIQELKKYHNAIALDLFESENNEVFSAIEFQFSELERFLTHTKSPNYSFIYDQVVSVGELVSTTLLSHYLNYKNYQNIWLDARTVLHTDSNYREGNVNWEKTQKSILKTIKKDTLYITQGFIGADENNFTTTLGREGSDYTAAIIGYCLNAESVTIWKDVPGVLNADPRYFTDTVQLNQISYREAIELAFYGASVIHPKTLQPLQNKEIPLYVKSFLNPLLPGTCVSKGLDLEPETPCFILKKSQILLSLSSLDFSFIVEKHLSAVFALFDTHKIKVNMIQNSAISFSVCLEDIYGNFELLKKELSTTFKVQYNTNVDLYTIRHFTKEAQQKTEENKTILLKQINRNTIQLVVKS